ADFGAGHMLFTFGLWKNRWSGGAGTGFARWRWSGGALERARASPASGGAVERISESVGHSAREFAFLRTVQAQHRTLMGMLRVADRDMVFVLPPSVDEWLPKDHLARFVVDAVGALDLRRVEGEY